MHGETEVHYYTGPAVWTRAVIETISRGDPAAPKCDDAQCVFNNRRKFFEFGLPLS